MPFRYAASCTIARLRHPPLSPASEEERHSPRHAAPVSRVAEILGSIIRKQSKRARVRLITFIEALKPQYWRNRVCIRSCGVEYVKHEP